MLKLISRIPLLRRFISSEPAPTLLSHRNEYQDVALVLVHGFSGNPKTTWENFVEFLLAEQAIRTWDIFSLGYPTSLRVDIPNVWAADPNLSVLAQGLKTTLSLPPFDRYKCLAVAAHSMGGLVVQRCVLDDTDLTKRVSHVFLFGTPSNGLVKAQPFGALKRQTRDMALKSPFIAKLRADWTEKFSNGTPFTFRAVAGDRDEFVPTSSSILPFDHRDRAVVPGNHLEIIKPSSREHPCISLVTQALSGGSSILPIVDGARLAVEIGNFREAVDILLPRAGSIDDAALASLALALEGLGRGTEALSILETRSGGGHGLTSTDALGVLAGRLKRRWLTERLANDFVRARELYVQGHIEAERCKDHAQGYYHSINVAFLDLMALPPDSDIPDSVKHWARVSLNHCLYSKQSHWRLATEGEAKLILSDIDQAEVLYKRAKILATSPREINSMYSQAIRISTRVFREEGARRIEKIFGVANHRS